MALRCSSTAAAARAPAAAAAPRVQAALRRAAPAALAGLRTGSLVQRLPLRALTVAAAAQPEEPAAAAAAEEVRCALGHSVLCCTAYLAAACRHCSCVAGLPLMRATLGGGRGAAAAA